MLPLIDDFRSIVIQDRPLIDTRALVEFAKGSFPNAVNLPLMNDKERELVGTTYKQKGGEAAIALGYQLVSGDVKESRVGAWVDFIQKHPDTYLFCWRGGQRSQIVQQWLQDTSITIPRLKGGYKAFRNYLMEESIRLAHDKDILIIGGRTGSGKTLLLERLVGTIDLEGMANHRGSSFGRYATPQPTQIDFENTLAYAQIQHDEAGHKRLIIEDESHNIGRCYIPHEVFETFQQGEVILLEATLQERIDITYNEYIIASQADYEYHHTRGNAQYSWIEVMQHNFDRIRKRLGDEDHRRLSDMLQMAWEHQMRTDDPSEHKVWIRELLEKYYDPMYDYQIKNKGDRIVFGGRADEIIEFLGGD
jgi:tRNA 2-selenouridine synthase